MLEVAHIKHYGQQLALCVGVALLKWLSDAEANDTGLSSCNNAASWLCWEGPTCEDSVLLRIKVCEARLLADECLYINKCFRMYDASLELTVKLDEDTYRHGVL